MSLRCLYRDSFEKKAGLIKHSSIAVTLILLLALIGIFPQVCLADATTYYVPDDYPTIQEAIDVAENGDTIEVESGVYHESISIDKQLTIIGQGNVEQNFCSFQPFLIVS